MNIQTGSRDIGHFLVHLLAPKPNCQEGDAPENDAGPGSNSGRFGLHGRSRSPAGHGSASATATSSADDFIALPSSAL